MKTGRIALFFCIDCKQSLSGQSRWCAHSAARLERGEINEKPPSARSLQFFSRSAISLDLDYPERDCLQSIFCTLQFAFVSRDNLFSVSS